MWSVAQYLLAQVELISKAARILAWNLIFSKAMALEGTGRTGQDQRHREFCWPQLETVYLSHKLRQCTEGWLDIRPTSTAFVGKPMQAAQATTSFGSVCSRFKARNIPNSIAKKAAFLPPLHLTQQRETPPTHCAQSAAIILDGPLFCTMKTDRRQLHCAPKRVPCNPTKCLPFRDCLWAVQARWL